MKLYHIKNSYGSEKFVIASDRSAFYTFRNKAGDISPLKKIYCDDRGWTVVSSNGLRKGISLNIVEIDYDREFSYNSLSGKIGISVMCDYESARNGSTAITAGFYLESFVDMECLVRGRHFVCLTNLEI